MSVAWAIQPVFFSITTDYNFVEWYWIDADPRWPKPESWWTVWMCISQLHIRSDCWQWCEICRCHGYCYVRTSCNLSFPLWWLTSLVHKVKLICHFAHIGVARLGVVCLKADITYTATIRLGSPRRSRRSFNLDSVRILWLSPYLCGAQAWGLKPWFKFIAEYLFHCFVYIYIYIYIPTVAAAAVLPRPAHLQWREHNRHFPVWLSNVLHHCHLLGQWTDTEHQLLWHWILRDGWGLWWCYRCVIHYTAPLCHSGVAKCYNCL